MAEKNNSAGLELHPFGNIAVAFSGGGFRAAAFALGTLSYLEKLELDGAPATKKITYIASASGGTITNLLYASAMHRGEDFNSFYQHAKQKMGGDQLLQQVLELLNDDSAWKESGEKRQNMINAFARVYDKELFASQTMAVLSDKKHRAKFEICCNSTEFYRGLSFRFQTNGTRSHDQLIGNRYLHFDPEKLQTFQKIRLADVLAASSCFPMGFEPIVFPEDFTYITGQGDSLSSDELREAVCYEDYNENIRHMSDNAPKEEEKQTRFLKSFGLMDGGITDNQALNSLMLADKKRRRGRKPNPFDLMLITDVGSYFMDYYEVPPVAPPSGWRAKSIGSYNSLLQKILLIPVKARNIALAGCIAFCGAAAFISNPRLRYPLLVLTGISLAITALAIIVRRSPLVREINAGQKEFDLTAALRRQLPLNSFSDPVINKLLGYLRLTRLNVLEQMLRARISSTMSMVSDVNLKQVRRLIYQIFYNDSCWDNRRVPNFIYELSTHNAASRHKRLHDPKRLKWKATEQDKELLGEGLELMNAVAEKARCMGTTLWFDKEDTKGDQLANIIKTGQFTTCMNLLEYVISLERSRVSISREDSQSLQRIKQTLIADIELFKVDPGAMYT